MIIGIDGNEANQKIKAGSGVYAYNLLWQIYGIIRNEKLKVQNHGLKCRIYLKNYPLNELPKESENWQYRIVKPDKLWTQIGLPLQLWKEKFFGNAPEVFFTPTHYAPRFCPVPSVVTIFDLSFIRFPEMFLKKDLYKLKNWTKYSVQQAKKIITISEFSKKEIINFYKIPSEKIVVAYPGFDEKKYNAKIKNQKLRIRNTIKKFKIGKEYILFIGTIQPRKNLRKLVEAFKILKEVYHNRYIQDLKLVICGMIKEGRGGWMMEDFKLQILSSRMENEIILTGYVDDNDLPYLIAGAKALILPSLYEGFGIPAVEAMACGIPTVVSKISSLPEVCGKGAIYIENPASIESINLALKKMLFLSPQERENLIKLGLLEVKRFSWRKSAEKILMVLMRVGEQKDKLN